MDIRLTPTSPADAVRGRAVLADDEPWGLDEHEQARLAFEGFAAKPGSTAAVTGTGGAGGTGAGPELLVGLGRREGLDVERVAKAVSGVLGTATGRGPVLALDLAGLPAELDPAAALAAAVGAARRKVYDFAAYRAAAPVPDALVLVHPSADDPSVAAAVGRAEAIARGWALACDLANEPGGTLTPPELGRRVAALARDGLEVVVHDKAALGDFGMGGLLAVNRGSTQPAVLVELRHEPRPGEPPVVLVGKGITFDSGGINLKQKASSLLNMKHDKAGAAAIVGAMVAVAELGVDVNVVAYLPVTDNMPGGDATRPGDVVSMADGTTVEIVDTDAEGRLVLADGLALANRREAPRALVDVASLTYTIIHATGTLAAGLWGTDDDLLAAIEAAATRSGDRVWPMPRVPEYQPLLSSAVAELTNRSEAPAASAIAALFLEHFAGATPWAHLDMYGCSLRFPPPPGGASLATGWGVKLLVELLEAMAEPGAIPHGA